MTETLISICNDLMTAAAAAAVHDKAKGAMHHSSLSGRIKCAACGGDENDGKICPVSKVMHISRRTKYGSTSTQVMREQERQEALERSKARSTQPVFAFTSMSQQPASVHAPPPAVPFVFAFPSMSRRQLRR